MDIHQEELINDDQFFKIEPLKWEEHPTSLGTQVNAAKRKVGVSMERGTSDRLCRR
jgi:hypothetical protein